MILLRYLVIFIDCDQSWTEIYICFNCVFFRYSLLILVNNIDLNVITNFLFGTTNLVLYHSDRNFIEKIFDEEMQKMYSDTIELIVFAIKNDLTNQ